MATEGEFPKADGDVLYASEVNIFEANRWNELVYVPQVTQIILAHSTTDWTILANANRITDDAGVTWKTPRAVTTHAGVARVCKVDGTKAISCEYNDANIAITSDSGDNWAQATTDPLNITRVLDLSFPTATIAVVGCDFGTAASGIFYSADAGDTWTASDFPAADCNVIDMISATVGIALHSDGSIYTTADSGATWTDSGQGVGGMAVPVSMVALTSTTGVKLAYTQDQTIETFDTTGGGTVRLTLSDMQEANVHTISNLVKTTNGNIYFVYYTFEQTGNSAQGLTLYRSTDSGVTWSNKSIGNVDFSAVTDLTTYKSKSQLVEYDTNKLLIVVGQKLLMKIDES